MNRELLIKLADALYKFDDSHPLLKEIDDALAKPEFEYEVVGEIDVLSYAKKTLYMDSIKPLNHRFAELVGSALYVRKKVNQSTLLHQTHSEQS